MMHIIVNEMNSTRAFITADHGFIYTYSPLREDSKVDKTSSDAKDVEVDRRYLITKKEQSRISCCLFALWMGRQIMKLLHPVSM